jgi:hypothetical protein
MIVAMLFLGAAACKVISGGRKICLSIAIIAALLLANRKDVINVAGILSGKITADLGPDQTAALAISPSSECGLLIDSWVARYLYDYRLPEGSLDLEFGAPFPGGIPGWTLLPPEKGPQFRPGDVFLASPRVVSVLVRYTYLEREVATWSPFGISRLALDKDPRRIYFIHAESCRSRRDKPLAYKASASHRRNESN